MVRLNLRTCCWVLVLLSWDMALKKAHGDATAPSKVQVCTIERMDCAQIERTHALTDGLFRPIDHKIERPSFHIAQQFKSPKGSTLGLEWQGVQLDITDQQVFLAILRIVSEKSRQLQRNSENTETWSELEKGFSFSIKQPEILVAKTSLYEICKVAGFSDGGEALESVYQSIHRMQCTRCWVYLLEGGEINRRTESSFSLIAHWGMKDGDAYIGINPFLTQAVQGIFQVTYLDMTHIRSLQNDVSKRLFMWLSAWSRYDRKQSIGLDKLVKHVWGDLGKDSPALRKRRMKVRSALGAISKLDGWTVNAHEDDPMLFQIKRPKYA